MLKNTNNKQSINHPVFCVLMHSPGPKWQEEVPFQEQIGVDEYIQYMRKQLSEGMLLIGGPFLDNSGGMMICRTTDIEKAKLIANSDPVVISGLLKVVVKKWMVPMTSVNLTSNNAD